MDDKHPSANIRVRTDTQRSISSLADQEALPSRICRCSLEIALAQSRRGAGLKSEYLSLLSDQACSPVGRFEGTAQAVPLLPASNSATVPLAQKAKIFATEQYRSYSPDIVRVLRGEASFLEIALSESRRGAGLKSEYLSLLSDQACSPVGRFEGTAQAVPLLPASNSATVPLAQKAKIFATEQYRSYSPDIVLVLRGDASFVEAAQT